jgi:hypothetical protein
MAEHKVWRASGDMELASKLDELTETGWEIVSVLLGQAWDGGPVGKVQGFIVVARKAPR